MVIRHMKICTYFITACIHREEVISQPGAVTAQLFDPAGNLEQSQRLAKRQESMIQTQAIPNVNFDWHPGSFDLTGRKGRKRHWRQILETPKPGRLSG